MAKKEIKQTVDFPFGKQNYILMFTAIALVVVGFTMMSGGGSDDPAVWNPEINNAMHITFAPIFVIAGFVVGIFAVMKKPKD